MNNSVTVHNFFDTHAFVKEMEAAGFSEAQAKVLANKQAELIDQKLATKSDLSQLKKDVIIATGGIVALGVGALGAFICILSALKLLV